MESLFPSFIALLLAGIGDRPQRLTAMIAAQDGRSGRAIALLGLATLTIALVATIGGRIAADLVTHRALTLMTGVALLFAGIGCLRTAPPPAHPAAGLLSSLLALTIAVGSGPVPLLIFALAGRADMILLPALGATVGAMAAALPALALDMTQLRRLRQAAAILLLLAAIVTALMALRLI